MQRFCLILLIIIGFCNSGHAQEASDIEWSLAYTGNNLWNPGLQVGYLKQGLTQHQNPVLYQAQLGFYLDPHTQFNLFGFAGLQYRGAWGSKTAFDIRLSPFGVFRSFFPETYRVLADGSSEKVFLAGRWYYAPECSFTLGINLQHAKIKQVFMGPQLIFLMPYDGRVLPILNFQIGLNLKP